MYQEIERKVANIMKWLPEFIEKNYDERRMGHLIENHLNIPDDRFILWRKGNCSGSLKNYLSQ